jgi:hypothetical protein
MHPHKAPSVGHPAASRSVASPLERFSSRCDGRVGLSPCLLQASDQVLLTFTSGSTAAIHGKEVRAARGGAAQKARVNGGQSVDRRAARRGWCALERSLAEDMVSTI